MWVTDSEAYWLSIRPFLTTEEMSPLEIARLAKVHVARVSAGLKYGAIHHEVVEVCKGLHKKNRRLYFTYKLSS